MHTPPLLRSCPIHLFLLLGALVLLPASTSRARAAGYANWEVLAGPVDPPPMYGHAAIHDAARHRLLMIAGDRPTELWSLSLPGEGLPTWSRIPVRGPSYPGERHSFTAVYDSVDDRVIVFGGWAAYGTDYADVWSLSLGDDPHWTLLEPAGEAPHSRSRHAAIFDPVRRRMVITGGEAYQGGQLADTWEFELAPSPRWRRIVTTGPAPGPREGARAVYDPWGDRLVLFGGWIDGTIDESGRPTYRMSDETWILPMSGATVWDSLALAVRPTGRQTFAVALDTDRRWMVVSGGEGWESGHDRSDTWALDLDGPPMWRLLEPSGTGPGPVSWHAAAYSPERGSMIQYGGTWTAVQSECFELRLDAPAWSRVLSPGPDPAPAPRSGASLIEDSDSLRVLLWGGFWWHDLWSLDPAGQPTWTHLETSGTAPTAGASNFVVDSRRRRLIALGGGALLNHDHKLDQIWSMSLDPPRVWTQIAITGALPVGRAGFGALYDPVRDRILVFGGCNWASGGSRMALDLGELWELSLAEPRWRLLQDLGAPGKLGGPEVLYDARRDRMLVLGGFHSGYDTSQPVYETWALDLSGDSLGWNPLGAALPGAVQTVIDPVHDRLIAWSGGADAWSLALARPDEWRPFVASGSSPTDRGNSGVFYDSRRDQLLVFGGWVSGGFPSPSDAGDLYALRFSTMVEVRVQANGVAELVPLHSHGSIEAAILASAWFGPDSVLVPTVTLAGAHAFEAATAAAPASWRDMDGDGRTDLVLHFPTDSLALALGDTTALVLAETPNRAILGRAHVRVVEGTGMEAIPRLALRVPSPAMDGLRVFCTLASAGSARLEVYDIAGRRQVRLEVPGVAPGERRVALAHGLLRSGIYFVRLTQGGRVVGARAVVLE